MEFDNLGTVGPNIETKRHKSEKVEPNLRQAKVLVELIVERSKRVFKGLALT